MSKPASRDLTARIKQLEAEVDAAMAGVREAARQRPSITADRCRAAHSNSALPRFAGNWHLASWPRFD